VFELRKIAVAVRATESIKANVDVDIGTLK
jgi:hypothetical protein